MSTEPLRKEPARQHASEARLLQLRREGETRGRVEGAGVRLRRAY